MYEYQQNYCHFFPCFCPSREDQSSMVIWEFTIPARVVGDPLNWVLITGSVYTVILLVLDRCMAVVKPAYWARVFTSTKVKVTLFVIFIFAVLINAPTYFAERLVQRWHPLFNKTLTVNELTEYGTSHLFRIVFLERVAVAYLGLLPLVLLSIGIVVLIVETLRRTQPRRAFRHQNSTSSDMSTSPGTSTSVLTPGPQELSNVNQMEVKSDEEGKRTSSISFTAAVVSTSEKSRENEETVTNETGRVWGLGASGVTTVIFIMALVNLINRVTFCYWGYLLGDEETLNPLLFSSRFVWVDAMRFLLLKINASITFPLLVALDFKFRARLRRMVRCGS